MADSNTAEKPLEISSTDAAARLLGNKETAQATTPETEVIAETPETSVDGAEAAITNDSRPEPLEEVAAQSDDPLIEEVTEEVVNEESTEEETPEETQPETEEQTEEVEEAPEEEGPFMTLKDGTEVTSDEAKKGYLRQQDYTEKTQTLAEDRQAVVAQSEQLQGERNSLAETLIYAVDIIDPALRQGAQTDWNALMESDPYEYQQQKSVYEQAQHRYREIQQQAQALTAQDNQRKAAAQQQNQAEHAKALMLAMPDFADPTKSEALGAELRKYGMANGLSKEEAGNISDHRIVIMMNKAMKYDKLQTAGQTVMKKKIANSAKKTVSPGKPVSGPEKTTNARKHLKAQAKKSGSVDDAVARYLAK